MRLQSSSWHRPRVAVVAIVLLVLCGSSELFASKQKKTSPKKVEIAPQQITHYHLDEPHTKAGFECFYNAEYDPAIKEFEAALAAHPNDPFAVNHLLTGVMFKEMYRIGALDTELYAKEGFLHSKQLAIDPKIRDRVSQLETRALELEEDRLNKNPNDVDALYSRGSTRGLKSTWMALIDKAWFSALRSAVGARRDHERVLELDPNYTDAKMVVGMHSYVIGSVPWAVKVAASIVGLSGSREKGIQLLYEAANGGGEASVDAKIALALFLRREQRYPEAIKIVDGLAASYPKNFLLALELANLYNASGNGAEAIATYRKLLKESDAGFFPADAHIEMAWYGLGESLRGQHDTADAAVAYEKVQDFQKADPDLKLRATLGAGEMYDAMMKRDEAVKRYQAVIASDEGDSPRAELAKRYLKEPFRM
ncbi:MAG TPA: tetratricopeptide repeat protein [Terriglobales bacterium]|jgi:tetratricopeptide (TPR) repeat protein|nr:tetratricopeptide repeat protein [Terriglobales bacterium]